MFRRCSQCHSITVCCKKLKSCTEVHNISYHFKISKKLLLVTTVEPKQRLCMRQSFPIFIIFRNQKWKCDILLQNISLLSYILHQYAVAYRGGAGVWSVQTPPPPPKFWRPTKIVPNSTRLWKLLKIAEFRTPTHQDGLKKGSKILKLPRFTIVLH